MYYITTGFLLIEKLKIRGGCLVLCRELLKILGNCDILLSESTISSFELQRGFIVLFSSSVLSSLFTVAAILHLNSVSQEHFKKQVSFCVLTQMQGMSIKKDMVTEIIYAYNVLCLF